MARRSKTHEPEAKPAESAPESPRGTKTAVIRAALKSHAKKGPKEIAEILKAEGWDIRAQQISVVKSAMKARRRKRVAAAPAPEAEAPAVPKDAVSIGLLQKAKKLAAQLGGIKEAKAAIDALAQIMD